MFARVKSELVVVEAPDLRAGLPLYIAKSQAKALQSFTHCFQDGPSHLSLVGTYDPILLCYKDKSWLTSPETTKLVWRKSAVVQGVIFDSATPLGVWRYKLKRSGKECDVFVSLFPGAVRPSMEELTTLAEQVAEYFGSALGNCAIE